MTVDELLKLLETVRGDTEIGVTLDQEDWQAKLTGADAFQDFDGLWYVCLQVKVLYPLEDFWEDLPINLEEAKESAAALVEAIRKIQSVIE